MFIVITCILVGEAAGKIKNLLNRLFTGEDNVESESSVSSRAMANPNKINNANCFIFGN